ncbi:hypothetical protein A499_09274 [Niallia nealsonii AAU1]|nr:hypothetical protein A499_09274 [Niallia nealsonii AAU1]
MLSSQTVEKPLNLKKRSLYIAYLLVPLNREVAHRSRGSLSVALAPWKAKCIQSAGDDHKPSFLK